MRRFVLTGSFSNAIDSTTRRSTTRRWAAASLAGVSCCFCHRLSRAPIFDRFGGRRVDVAICRILAFPCDDDNRAAHAPGIQVGLKCESVSVNENASGVGKSAGRHALRARTGGRLSTVIIVPSQASWPASWYSADSGASRPSGLQPRRRPRLAGKAIVHRLERAGPDGAVVNTRGLADPELHPQWLRSLHVLNALFIFALGYHLAQRGTKTVRGMPGAA